jgi:hypothetical protein
MKGGLLAGALAGAAGTTTLNAVTYADMVMRGRPSSQVPEQTVETIAGRAGMSLGEDETAANRRQGLAALLGRVRTGRATAALGLGIAASVAGEAPATALGLTDPRTWGTAGWLSDLVPHLAYGIVTATTYDRLTRCASRPR